MAWRIAEYKIPCAPGFARVQMPESAVLMTAHSFGEEIRFWAIGETPKSTVTRLILILKNGDETVPPTGRRKFLATVAGPMAEDGFPIPFHMFDCGQQ